MEEEEEEVLDLFPDEFQLLPIERKQEEEEAETKGIKRNSRRDMFNIIRVFYLVFIAITNNSAQALEQEHANGEEEQEEVQEE